MKNVILLFICLILWSCSPKDYFKSLEYELNGPVDVSVSEDGKYFYVLNTDFSNIYNESSILVINEEGQKISKISIPRLAKKLSISGTDMIVTYDKSDDNDEYKIQLYSLEENPIAPKLQKEWRAADGVDCLPINVALRANYKYFAVVCTGGKLFIGELKTPRNTSTLKLVRNYQYTRNAIYLDPKREVIFMFPTIFGKPNVGDMEEKDIVSLNPQTGKFINQPNEVPDIYEQSNKRKDVRTVLMRYLLVVYNIKHESTQEPSFPYRETYSDYVLANEYKWIYFNLKDIDEQVDSSISSSDLSYKYYRTNFVYAKEDPLDDDSFYISHRGLDDKSPYANNIIKVHVKQDISDVNKFALMKTSDFLEFTRVYGFKHERQTSINKFPGIFTIQKINDKYFLIINHFKDLVSFGKKEFSSAISIKNLENINSTSNLWEIQTTDIDNSFYQAVFNSKGKGISCAFYGNKLILLEFDELTGIKLGWSNNLQTIE